MKKKIALLMACTMAAASLAGCGGGNSAKETTAAAAPAGQTEVLRHGLRKQQGSPYRRSLSACRQSCRRCIELHGESAERGRESPFCVQYILIQECF